MTTASTSIATNPEAVKPFTDEIERGARTMYKARHKYAKPWSKLSPEQRANERQAFRAGVPAASLPVSDELAQFMVETWFGDADFVGNDDVISMKSAITAAIRQAAGGV